MHCGECGPALSAFVSCSSSHDIPSPSLPASVPSILDFPFRFQVPPRGPLPPTPSPTLLWTFAARENSRVAQGLEASSARPSGDPRPGTASSLAPLRLCFHSDRQSDAPIRARRSSCHWPRKIFRRPASWGRGSRLPRLPGHAESRGAGSRLRIRPPPRPATPAPGAEEIPGEPGGQKREAAEVPGAYGHAGDPRPRCRHKEGRAAPRALRWGDILFL